MALAGRAKAARVLATKADFFWESLAQQLAERIFGEELTPPVYLHGVPSADAPLSPMM